MPIVLLWILMLICTNADKPRLWTRIPKYFVDERVKYFLSRNRITDCYSFKETSTNLLLKCKIDNILTDVSIEINPTKRKRRYFPISITI
jgi:hypothetical protein